MAKRVLPSITEPSIKWIKAVLPSSGEIMGVACWTAPGTPILAHFRRDAVDVFNWQNKMKWTDAELDDMWAGTSDQHWNMHQIQYDDVRREVMGDEPHWFLSPVITWPEYQGRGVGKKLMMWAIEQADSTVPPTPIYLESAPTARAMYMHLGFVPQGEVNMVRRGPAKVKSEDADELGEKAQSGR
jgi:predicted GNAT family N-acyltransferase